MALLAVKDKLERVLDKNMQDLVRGIRKHKNDESKYINECMEEIKNELKQGSFSVKANAINKLIYLQMLGYDISWSVFNIVEVMSSPKFTYKRIGYLAASQSFHVGTDVLMLATNLIRKDLNSAFMYDAGIALSGLACFMTPDLASDLHSDVLSLMNSPKPYLRKKSVLLLYKIFLNYPEALRTCFPRLKDKLEDPDPGVQSAAVNVICELARQNPKNYLSLSPIFFKLMTSSTNNWVLIKIIKLFGTLTTLEPRLGKKILEPLTNLIHSTSATSLLYECINTLVAVLISISAGAVNYQSAIQLCILKLRILIEDSDQNLKYLGLLAMRKFLSYYPTSVQPHKDLILSCLDDKDESIRLRALDLLHGMISKSNLVEIVKHVVQHIANMSGGMHYRNELVTKIVQICSQDHYQYITSFEWYISILLEIGRMDGIRNGELLASQLMDVAIRVPTVRPFCVEQMSILLAVCPSLLANSKHNAMKELVCAGAWICGEYAVYLPNPCETLTAILDICHQFTDLPGSIQSVLIMNTFKLCRIQLQQWTVETSDKLTARWDNEQCLAEDESDRDSQLGKSSNCQIVENLIDKMLQLITMLVDKYSLLVHSSDLEVQERAVSIHQLLCTVTKRLNKFKSTLYNETHLPNGNKSSNHSPSQSSLGPSPALSSLANPPHQIAVSSVDLKSPNESPNLSNNSVEVNHQSNPAGQATDTNLDKPNELEPDQVPSQSNMSVLSADIVLSLINRLVKELVGLFPGEINPVAPKAQLKVPVPADLDLDAWINPPTGPRKAPLEMSSVSLDQSAFGVSMERTKSVDNPEEHTIFPNLTNSRPSVRLTTEQLEEMRLKRLKDQENNPHYLKGTTQTGVSQSLVEPPTSSPKRSPLNLSAYQSLESEIPKQAAVARPIKSVGDNVMDIGLAKSDYFIPQIQDYSAVMAPRDPLKKSKSHKLRKTQSNREYARVNGFSRDADTNSLDETTTNPPSSTAHIVRSEFDMPEGMVMDVDSSSEDRDINDPHRRLNIVLDDLLPQPPVSTKSKKTKHKLSNVSQLTNSPDKLSQSNAQKSKCQPVMTNPSQPASGLVSPTTPHLDSNFLLNPSSIGQEEFAQLLMNGSLTSSKSAKFKSPFDENSSSKAEQFHDFVKRLTSHIPCSVVESIDSRAASLYAIDSRSNQPVCSLMKLSLPQPPIPLRMIRDQICLNRQIKRSDLGLYSTKLDPS